MTSNEIRQSFFDFFKSKQHTIVPSSSLMPDAPNLLFTNAGMNQFVPIFLGDQPCPYDPPRAADTQKCIRAGGKHNDLDDVGLDTYHHTFFEMLGNWSFGDYFKKEAIAWAWELVTGVWGFPKRRLYATVYAPSREKGEPGEFDHEAYDHWKALFSAAGLDPDVHVVHGNKEDNFWMMGDTGPCGPCSELHVDLTPQGDTGGRLVNRGAAECIEIWNLVFIQYNANPDGTFSPLPATHVDTGMGFERVSAVLQCTSKFTDFTRVISNYETDVFKPLFDAIERLSGKAYKSTLPAAGATGHTEQEQIDIAFRVIADHIRTLGFSIADGILPGNSDRNYVLRRILRRAVRYGRILGFHEPFFFKLVDVLVGSMGDAFPELSARREVVRSTIRSEEEAFNKTLDRGIELFRDEVAAMGGARTLPGDFVFKLYDTYGFPLDLTELMARESGLSVDTGQFNKLMEEQRARARAARKQEVISVSSLEVTHPTRFVGFDELEISAPILDIVVIRGKTVVVLESSSFYAEMGGQVGDTGELTSAHGVWRVVDTRKHGETFLHYLDQAGSVSEQESDSGQLERGVQVQLKVDVPRRRAIERHHTVTHLFHWALHEVVGPEATQKGSYVGPEKLTFDFNSAPLDPDQIREIERRVNECVLQNSVVSWTEIPYLAARERKDILQFFGDKYGDRVRVVQIGGEAGALNGFSMELCGGTHIRATGEIGQFRILSESAVAAGVRRIEAVAGMPAYERALGDTGLIGSIAGKLNAPVVEVDRKIDQLLEQNKALEKRLKAFGQKQAAMQAKALIGLADMDSPVPSIIRNEGDADGDQLQAIADSLKGEFSGVVVLGAVHQGSVALVATVSAPFTRSIQAGQLIREIAPVVGGKGGGRPENARGGGRDGERLDDALAQAARIVRAAAVEAKPGGG